MLAARTEWRRASWSPREAALCAFAEKLAREPGRVTRADVDDLRSQGLDDREISDATQVIAYFSYINRVADGLGVDLEPGMPPHGTP